MATYKVIRYFTDLQDNNNVYNPADPERNTYPRKGLEPTAERIAELSGSANKQGRPLIELVEEDKGGKSIDKMTKAELQAYAAEKGIDLTGANTNAEIIAKIKEAEEQSAE